jgi:hypothetical protein
MDAWMRIGIFLAVLGVAYILWRLLNPFIFSALAHAIGAHKMEPLPSADMRPDPRAALRVASAAAPAGRGFDRQAVTSVGGDWETAARLNTVLARVQARRQPVVAREGALRTRIAWKLAVFRQAALFRIVALAAATTNDWNARNVLGAALAARGLLEATALLQDFERRLQLLAGETDLAGIDALVTERGFASPLDGGATAGTDPALLPALIDAIAAPDGSARADYDALSGLCDAGALGQYRVFGELDKAGTTVTFSAEAGYERGLFGHVLGSFGVLEAAEAALQAIEEKQALVAGLESATP